MQQQLAKITKAGLSIVNSGILTFYIEVRYENGGSQSVGNLCLDSFAETTKGQPYTRVGTAYGCEMIRQLLLTLEVDNLADAKDKIIWVLGEGEGLCFRPTGFKTLNVHGVNKVLEFNKIAKAIHIKEIK